MFEHAACNAGKGSYTRPNTPALSMLSRHAYGRGGGLPMFGSIHQDRYTLPPAPSNQVSLSSVEPLPTP